MAHNQSFSVVCLTTSLLFCVSVLIAPIGAQWVIDDDGCRTPDGGVGDCIPIKRCKPITDFLANAARPISQTVVKKLNAYTCGYESSTVKVCCPPNPISINSGVIPKTPSPPDVTGHKNFDLLPKECGYLPLGDKITNGQNAALNEFPWMALLSYSTRLGPKFKCGGSIINDQWILTAAHCVSSLKEPLRGVRVGEHNIDTDEDCEVQEDGSNKCSGPLQDLSVLETVVHPAFNLTIISNDIALLKVTRMNLNVENVRPVCLPVDENTRNSKLSNAVVTGWGVTETGLSSKILQKVTLPVITTQQCQNAYKQDPRVQITHKQICAGGKDKKDSCPGDSGGPLHVAGYLNEETRYVQQGIVSFGPKLCGLDGFPGVYTRIAYYMDWILDTIHT